MVFQTATIGHLRSLFAEGPDPVFLLGAGASVKSGVPLANEMVEKIAKWGYCKENSCSTEDPSVRRSDWYQWLENQDWYQQNWEQADNYPSAVENILQPREARKEFFLEILNTQVQPSKGYECMVELMGRKFVRTVLTTNFDTILLDLCKVNRRLHHVDVIQTASDFITISTSPQRPQLIYLHGSVQHYTDKNTLAEINKELNGTLVSKLMPLLSDHPLIVMGYRGAESSVMQHLLINHTEIADNYRNGIYWCDRNYDEGGPNGLAPFVHELASQIHSNFQVVPIDGFDNVMEMLKDYVLHQQLDSAHIQITTDSEESTIRSYDLQPIKASSLDDFEWPTMIVRLSQYCERTGIPVPPIRNNDWIIQLLRDQELTSHTEEGNIFPTVGGCLLFAKNPQSHIQSAQVIVRVKGNPEWLERVFGDTGNDDEIIGNQMERIIEGNLWSQRDMIFDILSLVNQPFLLKDEVSITVQPYSPGALREIVVNALVHRDYTQTKPIIIEIEQTYIRVRNPGGLVPDVVNQVGSQPSEEIKIAFENQIKSGVSGIKGYRNPIVADLFYGAGVMEKEGSGLSDVWRSCTENRNEVKFGPIYNNTAFEITIHSRPEVVDEVTKTAYHRNFIRYASNILEVVKFPDVIRYAGTDARKPQEVLENAGIDWVPPFILHEGMLFTFHDLSKLANSLYNQINVNDTKNVTVEEFIANYGEERFVWLLNECFYRHLKAKDLWIDRYRKRVYFPRTDDGPRTIEYQARVRRATRTVVKRKNRYWEHKSFRFRFERFADAWTLVILPSYVFTTDGRGNLLEGNLVNRLSTTRQSRDYNNVVHNDLVFWSWVLSGGQQSTFTLNINPTGAQESSNSLNEVHNGSSPQIFIKANLLTTVDQDVEPDSALHYRQIENLESNRLAQLESEFSQEISQLEEVENVDSD